MTKKQKSKFVDTKGTLIYPMSKESKIIRRLGKFGLMTSIGLLGAYFVLEKLVGLVLKLITSILVNANLSDVANDTLGLKSMVHNMLMFFGDYTKLYSSYMNIVTKINFISLFKVMIVVSVIFYVIYGITLMFRHHYGEHYPFHDDNESIRLKRQALDSLDLNYNPNEVMNESNNGKRKLTKLEQDVRNCIKRMDVSIHTRKNLDDNVVIKSYVIKVPQHRSTIVRNNLIKILEPLSGILTSLTSGAVSFGTMEDELSRQYFTFSGSLEVVPKYMLKSSKSGNGSEETLEYNWVFPLELFKDNTSEIATQVKKAEKYAEQQRKSIDVYLATAKIQATLKKVDVGNTSMMFVYQIPFTINSNIGSLQDNIENAIRVKGVMVSLEAGDLVISAPLKEDVVVPLDVPTMLKEIYG